MNKTETKSRRAGIIGLTIAAVVGSAAATAGPFCMNGQRGVGPGMYPHSAMGAYPGMQVPQRHYGMPAPASGAQAGRTDWRAPGQAQYRGAYGPPAMQPPAQTRATQPAQTDKKAQEQAKGDSVIVRIDGMRFKPATITVKPGTTVTWIHNSTMPHTVSGDTEGLSSSTMYGGEKYSYTFDKSGSYSYACDLHPGMKGKVVVEGGGQRT